MASKGRESWVNASENRLKEKDKRPSALKELKEEAQKMTMLSQGPLKKNSTGNLLN